MRNTKLIIVQIGSALLGLIVLIIGGQAVYQGAAGKLEEAAAALGDVGVLAGLDNDLRFFAAVSMIIGLGLIFGAIFIHTKPEIVQMGLGAIFVGGIARAFAMIEYGMLPQFYAPIAVELIIPPVLLLLLKLRQREQKVG